MARTILIVDDNPINRSMLSFGLQTEYDIMEASDGREALVLIRRNYKFLSAVLLDLQMPVMDGFEVLEAVRRNPLLTQLPVIVVTGTEDESARLRALECGANDFVQKPFNPDIIKHCLKNNIALRESASIINAIQKDKLTGVFNREYFFEKAGELIKTHEPGTYILSCFDIDNFKLINDQYGAAEGDRILRHIGVEMQKSVSEVKGICGRISGDNFAMLYPDTPETAKYVAKRRESDFISADTQASLRFSVGRYAVTDLSLPVSAQYDRAYIAKQSVKGRYDAHVADFDESMLQALILEQQIIGEMDRALARREFEVWLQPQYNHATGALIGAEALVRWRHPTKGLILPGDFIPVFEQNGFVYELDKYVWEEACRYIRKWLDEGRDPLPVSVNISRYDVFRPDLITVLTELIAKYDVPVELLRLEITESAFSESTAQIIATVKRFIELRFTVEIDDFGNGYSSLNTLKDVPAQVLKLDMRFFESSGSTQRSGSILESVTRMARWIGMAVIAEGVETHEQADFLKSIGCNYVQGYLYEKPLPLEKYEALARTCEKEERLISFEAVVTLDSDSFWDPSSLDTLVFNSFVGGACIFEACNGDLDLLRVNDSYIRELGISCEPGAPLSELAPFKYLPEDRRQAFHEAIERAATSGEEQICELLLSDDGTHFPRPQYIRSAFRVIAKAGDRQLYYCVINNLSAQRQAEQSSLSAIEQLTFLNDMAHGLLAQPDVEEGLNDVLNKLRQAFEGTRAYIFEFNYEKHTTTNTYEVCADGVSREKDNLQNISLDLVAFWIEAFKHQNHYAIEDIDLLGDDRAQEREVLRAQGIKSIFVAPLYRDGSLIGMIGIDDPARRYAQVDQLAALGDYIAVMLTRRDLNARIVTEDNELLQHSRKPGAGLREVTEAEKTSGRRLTPGVLLKLTLALCVVVIGVLLFASSGRPGSHMDSFSEAVVTISDGWTLTDSSGVSRPAELPLTIEYGTDGLYTLTGTLPESAAVIQSPALCVYSNYVDLYVEVDGEPVLVYPAGEEKSEGATGNTYHYIRLPSGYGGKTVSIELSCQLGDSISYLLKAPVLGSKATMLNAAIAESLPSMLLSGCLIVLAIILAVMNLLLKKKLVLNSSTAYTSIFAVIFAVYVFTETAYAQYLTENPYMLFSATLMLLALVPIPLIGLFSEEISDRFRKVPPGLMILCSVNFIGQIVLNCAGVLSYRSMLPATHVSIIAAITAMAVCLFLSSRSDKPAARKKLLTALPMIAGGMADILLLMLNRPSFNNSLWFTLGVAAFIAIQFIGFVRGFFAMYRVSLEATVLRDMAYRDMLTNMGNRNAYERKLKELTGSPISERLCCIVADINDLKLINDGYGHAIGDAAIVETSRILSELVPGGAFCFRSGGDEFVVLIDGFDNERARALTAKLTLEAEQRGKRYSIPLSLAVGFGCYEQTDGNILDFIRRIDARMYEEKRRYKSRANHTGKVK